MDKLDNSILVIGFNTRPLVYSLNKAGFEVYAVDFFGDLDFYPYVKDSIIITESLGASYLGLKEEYSNFIVDFAIKLLKKYPNVENFLISSGLDDAYDERSRLGVEFKKINPKTHSLNNPPNIIKESRDVIKIQKKLDSWGYLYPSTFSYIDFKSRNNFDFPFILKRRTSSGGLNVHKIDSESNLKYVESLIQVSNPNFSDWQVQEYLEGIPASCTVISNGNRSKVVTINRQIIGEKFCNSPKDFMYCGNIVPANLFESDNKKIAEISLKLVNHLKLKGINGIDFILKNHDPYFIEINPRIPGSIRASECALNLNLLDLHVKSFKHNEWKEIENKLDNVEGTGFVTKLIYFAPKEIPTNKIIEINKLPNIHDKSKEQVGLHQQDPVCTILFKAESFADSFFGALKITNKINEIVD